MSKSKSRDCPRNTRGVESGSEDKRVAARRRFLLGGAAALPVIVTLGQKQAWAASSQVCASAGLGFGDGFTNEDYNKVKNGLTTSLYCRPENL